ncbi:hypothetical protein [Synechococcus sp. PCC 7336]|nr:hypothetical protein [Synechococcus sp. PCC 7336]
MSVLLEALDGEVGPLFNDGIDGMVKGEEGIVLVSGTDGDNCSGEA